MIDLLGTVAGVLTTFAYAPQVYRCWVTKSVGDVSLTMYAVMCAGISLWLAYGLLIGSLPLVLANSASLLLTTTIIALRLRYGGRSADSQSRRWGVDPS